MIAIVTFSLSNIPETELIADDYNGIRIGLTAIKLFNFLKDPSGQVRQLPYNTFVGSVDAPDTTMAAKTLSNQVSEIFKSCGKAGTFFVTVSDGPVANIISPGG